MISVVIPLYNEEEVLPEFYTRFVGVLANSGEEFNMLFVNDGSSDKSRTILEEMARKDARVKLINLSRNFGHQIAVKAGIDHSSGDAVIITDCDLQDPPEIILDFINKWREGYNVVYGRRPERKGEGIFKKTTAALFYKLIRKLSGQDIPENVGDFRLIDKKVADELKKINEFAPFIRGLVTWTGFRQTGVDYVRDERYAGSSKYPLKKMIKLALDAIFSFSKVPLRVATIFGLAIAFISFIFGIFTIVARLFLDQGIFLQGWASLMTIILFLGGIQLFMIGILGEYIGRIFDQVKGRPMYIVESAIGLDQ